MFFKIFAIINQNFGTRCLLWANDLILNPLFIVSKLLAVNVCPSLWSWVWQHLSPIYKREKLYSQSSSKFIYLQDYRAAKTYVELLKFRVKSIPGLNDFSSICKDIESYTQPKFQEGITCRLDKKAFWLFTCM